MLKFYSKCNRLGIKVFDCLSAPLDEIMKFNSVLAWTRLLGNFKNIMILLVSSCLVSKMIQLILDAIYCMVIKMDITI